MLSLREHSLDSATLRTIQLFLNRLAAYRVRQAILFGSHARNRFRPDSDADVAIALAGPADKSTATKLAMVDIAYDVLLETGVRVQPLPIWEEQWEHPNTYPNPQLLHNIEREGVVL
jgi:predicted nucleotidyltransferase